MAQGSGTLTEIRLEPDGLSGRIAFPPALRPAPGQYLVASGPDAAGPLPVVLFPGMIEAGELQAAPPLPSTWTVGMQLALRGPLGNGFHLPGSARRVALASLAGSPTRLLPLALQALAQQAAVVVYSAGLVSGIAEEVEVLPLDLLREAISWADFLALDATLQDLETLRDRLGLSPFQRPSCSIEVLVVTAMPCSGLAECGVCAVHSRSGWELACSDGPVFDFYQLEGV